MSEFSLQLSPSCNLKNHVSSAVAEVIRLVENFSLHGNDEDQLDFTLYKLEQIVWSDFLTVEIIQLLLTAYNSLSKENDDTHFSQSSSSGQVIYTGSVGRPALDIPRETLKLYLSYGFSLQKIEKNPQKFEQFFVHQDEIISPEFVKKLLKVPDSSDLAHSRAFDMLLEFIETATKEELVDFLSFTTGSKFCSGPGCSNVG